MEAWITKRRPKGTQEQTTGQQATRATDRLTSFWDPRDLGERL